VVRALLDVNVLIALFDSKHVFHDRGHDWWASHHHQGWASTAISENGLIRIMSNPNYSQRQFSPAYLVEKLEEFVGRSNHEFWPGNITLKDSELFRREALLQPTRP